MTATGLVKVGHYKRRRRRELLDFVNNVVVANQDKEIHVILDNLNTHNPKEDRWLKRNPNVRFHFTPTHASWLNQVEIWFNIITQRAIRRGSFKSVRDLITHIERFVSNYNPQAKPFVWTATADSILEKFQRLCQVNYGTIH